MNVGKQLLIEKKQQKQMKPTLNPYEIIVLVNYA